MTTWPLIDGFRGHVVTVSGVGGRSVGGVETSMASGDSFEATALGDVLADLGVGHGVVTGAQTDACIRATLHGAFVRGYDVTLVSDAHTTEDLTTYGARRPDEVVVHANLYWQFQGGPDRTADVVAASDVAF